MGGDFEVLDHTADVGIIAYGADTKQAFANAARGLFSLITELDDINENLYRDIEVTATDEAALLVNWLNELIYQFDTHSFLFNRFEFTIFGHRRLKARAYGERVDSSRHRLKTGVKAATYHLLEISQGGGRVSVIFDI